MLWKEWLEMATNKLTGSLSPKRDAEILLGKVTGQLNTRLLAFGEIPLNDLQNAKLETLLKRRANGEPIAYLTGEREFWSLPLKVSSDTLIPRPDTECLVEQVLTLHLSNREKVLDLGTGGGAIALAIASERPGWDVIGVDCYSGAVVLASHNASQLGIKNVKFLYGDWFQALQAEQKYNLIVSNPPYIDHNDPHLCQGDVRFEPKSALVAENHGLGNLMLICRDASNYLLPGGWVVLEHGWKQAATVRALLDYAGFNRIITARDYGNNERVSLGQWLPFKPISRTTMKK